MLKKLIRYLLLLTLWFVTTSSYSQSLPQVINPNNQIIHYDGYTISYNETYEQPNWVYYVLKPSDLIGEPTKRRNNFRVDSGIESGTASLDDYVGSGYDRGHLKPAGDEPCDSTQMSETFYMSNISPQDPSFNRGIWKKLENYVRTITETSDSVVVITGGVLTEGLKTIGENEVAVPEFFFKVLYIYSDGGLVIRPFLLKNEKSNESLNTFLLELMVLSDFIGLYF